MFGKKKDNKGPSVLWGYDTVVDGIYPSKDCHCKACAEAREKILKLIPVSVMSPTAANYINNAINSFGDAASEEIAKLRGDLQVMTSCRDQALAMLDGLKRNSDQWQRAYRTEVEKSSKWSEEYDYIESLVAAREHKNERLIGQLNAARLRNEELQAEVDQYHQLCEIERGQYHKRNLEYYELEKQLKELQAEVDSPKVPAVISERMLALEKQLKESRELSALNFDTVYRQKNEIKTLKKEMDLLQRLISDVLFDYDWTYSRRPNRDLIDRLQAVVARV